jgi:ABC-2 type transport system permease protein
MRRAWNITLKELLQNRRDRLATLFTVFLPVIFTVVLGLLIGSADSGRLPLALADDDGSAVARELVRRLGDSPLLEVREMPSADVDDAVHDHKVAAGLVIPAGFGAAVEAGRSADLTFVRIETITGAQSAREAVNNAVSELNASMLAGRSAAEQVAAKTGVVLDDALIASARSLADAQSAVPTVTVELATSSAATDTHAGGFDQSSPGMIVNFVLFGLMGVTSVTVLERRRGLLRRLNVAGLRAWEIIAGKMMAMFALTFLEQLLLVLVGQFVLGVDYFNSPLALLATMVSLSLFAAAFGLLICTAFRSESAVIATIVISAQLLAALGGAWFPLEITGAGFSRVAHFLPTAWIMDSLHGIILKGWGIGAVLLPLAVVWAWIVGLFGIAVWRYRPE